MTFDCDVIVGGYVGGFLAEFGEPLREMLVERNTFEPDSSYLKFSAIGWKPLRWEPLCSISKPLFRTYKPSHRGRHLPSSIFCTIPPLFPCAVLRIREKGLDFGCAVC